MALDVITILTINAFFLLAVFVILVLLLVFSRPRVETIPVSQDLKEIKNQIENEAEMESEDELRPYKPARLDKPTRRRL